MKFRVLVSKSLESRKDKGSKLLKWIECKDGKAWTGCYQFNDNASGTSLVQVRYAGVPML